MKTLGIKIRRRLLTGMEFGKSCLQGTRAPKDESSLRVKLESFLEWIVKYWMSRALGGPF